MAYGAIHVRKLEAPYWGIYSTYFSRSLVDAAKAVPGMRFYKSIEGLSNVWVGYQDAVAATAARLEYQGIQLEWADTRPEPESWRESRTPYVFAVKDLRPYQVEGVRFLLARAREGALLADGMRLGKSAMSITAARAFKEKTIVLCPPHIVGVWSRPATDPSGPGELAKFWPAAKVIKLEGTKSSAIPDDVDVVVCHYDLVYAWGEALLEWGGEGGFTLILDEVHLIVGYTSRRSKTIKNLRAAATRTIGLSGTPLSNNPRKFHNVLDILSPGRFGPFFIPPDPEPGALLRPTYAVVYCASHQETVGHGEGQKTFWKHDGATNLDTPDGDRLVTREETLGARVQHMMLRRLKKDVDPELPQKTRQIIDVVVPAKAMIGVNEGMFAGGGDGLRRVLDLAADAKLKSVVELVANHLLEGERVLCFCYRRAFAERVLGDVMRRVKGAVEGVRGEFVHGGIASPKERERRIQALREHIGPALLACTIDTTSTGIDLSFASVAVFAEFTWEPHEHQQAEERLYKFGKNKKSLVQYVIARGTGDELIVRAVVSKLDSFERVIGQTGDGMKQDLAGKKSAGLKALAAALMEMQKAPEPKKKRARR